MKALLAFTTRLSFFALLLIAGLSSCSKDDEPENTDVVTKNGIPLQGSQEVPVPPAPPVVTSGSGTVDISYTKSTNMLMYTATWTGLTAAASNMHFHGPAARGANAGVRIGVIGFPTATSGTVSGMATLTDEQETDLLANKYYYNIHTATYPGGELRGQIEF